MQQTFWDQMIARGHGDDEEYDKVDVIQAGQKFLGHVLKPQL